MGYRIFSSMARYAKEPVGRYLAVLWLFFRAEEQDPLFPMSNVSVKPYREMKALVL